MTNGKLEHALAAEKQSPDAFCRLSSCILAIELQVHFVFHLSPKKNVFQLDKVRQSINHVNKY